MARPFESMRPALTRLGPPPETARRELLLIHGAWGGAWVWDGLSQDLAAEGYGVNLIEQPGHGQDRWNLPSLTSVNDYADLSRRAAASLGRPVLVGHSLGGYQVQNIWQTVDLPGVLLAPLPGWGLPFRTFIKLAWSFRCRVLRTIPFLPMVVSDTKMARELFFSHLGEAAVAEHLTKLAPEPGLVCQQMALWLHVPWLMRVTPRKAQQPRLLIAAEKDYFFPPDQQKELADDLGAEFEVVDAPHDLWLEDPQAKVKSLLLDFLKGLN